MADRDEARKFEQSLLGWLDDAYNLARWLLRNDQDAQDAVQDAFMRAARYAGARGAAGGVPRGYRDVAPGAGARSPAPSAQRQAGQARRRA